MQYAHYTRRKEYDKIGGKSSAPAAPDYVGQAQATAAGNLSAARSQTSANRIDQITPYGTINYTQGDGFDQGGYDAAMSKYNSQQQQIQQNAGLQEYYGKTGQLLSAPDRNSFMTNPDHWSSQIQLSNTGQQLLDAQNASQLRLAGLQGQAADQVANSLNNNAVSATTGMDGWQKYSDMLMQLQNPQLNQQQSALDTKLANQGLVQGSDGWNQAQNLFANQRNQANIQAQLAGAQVQNQMFQQAQYLQSLPMNEYNALRSATQVSNPTFSTPGQQGQTSGPDLAGAGTAQYNAALNQTNAQNAQAASNTQAGVGLAGTAIMAAAMY